MRALCHAFYVEGRITRQEFNAAKGGLNDALIDRVGPGGPELRWGEGPVAEQRAVIEREVRRIVVLPARRHRAFDPTRVVIMWSVSDDWMLVEEVAETLRIARYTTEPVRVLRELAAAAGGVIFGTIDHRGAPAEAIPHAFSKEFMRGAVDALFDVRDAIRQRLEENTDEFPDARRDLP